MNPLPYYLCYAMPLTFFVSLYFGGWGFSAVPILGFIIIPIADFIFGRDTRNLTQAEEEIIKNKFSFQLVTLLWVPTQFAIVLCGAYVAANYDLGLMEMFGLCLAAGMVSGGIGITIAHELCHRQSKHEQLASQVILMCLNYMHFHIEHVVGHHQRVSTPDDPASSVKGQNLFQFLPQTIIGSYKSAWEFEAKRVKVKKLKIWQNRMIAYLAIQGIFMLGLLALFGPVGLIFQVMQSFIGLTFLEIVNYIEHYGLKRQQLPNGRFEKVQPIHSWNANHKVSNLMLFKLQRHSDHHANALRRYQILRDFQEAPQLPLGYPTMILAALIPPLWRKIMDPMVDRHNDSIRAS